VLVVDDNGTNRQILRQQLGAWGMSSEEVASGSEALARLRAAGPPPFDLVILDCQMPEMNGLEVARAIRAEPALAALPLVLLTSVGHDEHAAAAREVGIAAYLTKPVRQSQLYDCLASVMGDAVTPLAPLAGRPAGAGGPRPAGATDAVPAAGAPRLLVVEDNFVNQKVAVYLLEARGYRVDLAGNGREALEAVARTDYDLVLMDCQMPELDGYGAAAAIRAREGAADHLLIVAMTAGAMEGEREKCLAAGMDDYITKPVTGAVLDRVLERWLPAESAPLLGPPASGRDGIASSAADGEKVLARLRSLGDADPQFVMKFVNLFLETAAEQLVLLETAAEQGDRDATRRVAHSLRGACGNLGADRLEALCAELEARARENKLTDASAAVRLLLEEYQRLRSALLAATAEQAPQ
jgi:CheY-like chemotaxis protein/HPt (histidine-containing phosphotransfer) domain-containing protein